jgi:alcohol dehydrogenase class IV
MVMRFEFATAQRILFGPGTLAEVGPVARTLASRALMVTGKHPKRSENLGSMLKGQGMEVLLHPCGGEPTVDEARMGAERARAEGCGVILGFGGGSALDLAKAIAALAANPGDPLRYLEVIGEGKPLEQRPLPCIAIPTTAGTGSEVTRNAVLASPAHGVKVSLRHPSMLPVLAVIDPQLTCGLPPSITASTGLDALVQLLEPYVSRKANALTDALCLQGIRCSVRSLRRAFDHGEDARAREDLALASLLGGMALANAGLGAVHGLAAPLGGLRPVPHGVACAALLPQVWKRNVQALRQRDGANPVLGRFEELARLLTGNAQAGAEDAVVWMSSLVADLGIPPLSRYGLQVEDIPVVAQAALQASSMQANPVKLTAGELELILAASL